MDRLKNEQGIRLIIMKPVAQTKCKIGQDWYTNELEINFAPADCYPDYMQVNEWIAKNIDGKELNIEDVVELLYDMLEQNFHPADLEITNNIRNCKTHFDVVVIK